MKTSGAFLTLFCELDGKVLRPYSGSAANDADAADYVEPTPPKAPTPFRPRIVPTGT